jgi:hypothetical protein
MDAFFIEQMVYGGPKGNVNHRPKAVCEIIPPLAFLQNARMRRDKFNRITYVHFVP